VTVEIVNEELIVYLNEGTPDGVTLDGVQVLKNKEIDLGSNTVTGTKAQFNAALTDGDFLFAGDAQPIDADLTAIAALAGTSGLLKKTAANTWVLDATSYQTQQSVNGLVKSSDATRSAAVAGTDYVAPGGALGTPSSGNLTNCTADGTNGVGFRNIPQNSQSANYTCVLSDAGKHLLHPSADTTARTFTIPANSSVAYPIGTALTFINQNGAGVLTIAITTDTMRMAGAGTTGSRTLAAEGIGRTAAVAAGRAAIGAADRPAAQPVEHAGIHLDARLAVPGPSLRGGLVRRQPSGGQSGDQKRSGEKATLRAGGPRQARIRQAVAHGESSRSRDGRGADCRRPGGSPPDAPRRQFPDDACGCDSAQSADAPEITQDHRSAQPPPRSDCPMALRNHADFEPRPALRSSSRSGS